MPPGNGTLIGGKSLPDHRRVFGQEAEDVKSLSMGSVLAWGVIYDILGYGPKCLEGLGTFSAVECEGSAHRYKWMLV